MNSFRQGDRLPSLRARAYTESGFYDLTVFASITFKAVSGETIITGSATGDAEGNLEYSWASGDTDIPGVYDAVFVGTDSSGKKQTFPPGQNLRFEIIAEL